MLALVGGVRRPARAARGDRARARRGGRQRPRAGPGGRPAPVRPRRDRGRRPASRARTPSWRPTRPGSGYADALRTAAEQAREALSSEAGDPDALATASAARTLLDGVREHDPEAGELADRLAEITYLLSDLAADVASYAAGVDADPPRLAAVSERRAALTALTRKYGETIDEVLAWAETSAARLLDLDGTDERIEALRAEQQSLRAELGEVAPTLSAARTEAAARLSDEVTAELALLAMPDARLEITVTQHDAEPPAGDPPPSGSPLRSASAGSGTRRAGSTRSSSCSPPTPAPTRGRCTRAPRAASCPG